MHKNVSDDVYSFACAYDNDTHSYHDSGYGSN